MAGFSTFYANQIINNLLRGQPALPGGWTDRARPGAIYFGLYTVAPTDAGGGTEVTGGSYARVAITQADGSWDAPIGSPAATENVGTISFPQATADWGTVVAFGLFDALSGGNMLVWGAVTPNRVVANGATGSFADGALDLTVD